MTEKPRKTADPDLKDVEPGSDADATPEPAQAENVDGEQLDDNIDDKGRKAGGGYLEQPR